jgi:hypothetical protein
MSECYYYEHLNLPSGSLDPSIDHLYIITMHESPRIKDIKDQAKRSGIVSNVTIQYNYGYKKCDKNLDEQKTNLDLVHALQTVFRHALSKGYERIMVLEDDCQFDERIHDPEVIDDLNSFLIKRDPPVYSLGGFGMFVNPIDVLLHNRNQLSLLLGASHCIVYNRKHMEHAAYKKFITGHVDGELRHTFLKYTYHKPLAYQVFEDTENSLEWGSWKKLFEYTLYPLFPVNKSVQPGFDNSKIFFDYVMVFICVFISFKIIRACITK